MMLTDTKKPSASEGPQGAKMDLDAHWRPSAVEVVVRMPGGVGRIIGRFGGALRRLEAEVRNDTGIAVICDAEDVPSGLGMLKVRWIMPDWPEHVDSAHHAMLHAWTKTAESVSLVRRVLANALLDWSKIADRIGA